MNHNLKLHWRWFALAFALGAVPGFLTGFRQAGESGLLIVLCVSCMVLGGMVTFLAVGMLLSGFILGKKAFVWGLIGLLPLASFLLLQGL